MTEAELDETARRAAEACTVPVVLIQLHALSGLAGVPDPGGYAGVKEVWRRQLKTLESRAKEGEFLRLPPDPKRPVRNLTATPIFIRPRGGGQQTASSKSSGPLLVGWVVLGADKWPESQQELVGLAVAERVSELVEIAALEETIRQNSRFLSIASHDLKTPLTSIYGILQLQERMLRQKRTEAPQAQLERQHSFLVMVLRQVERLNELIDGLLNLSRIQNGRFKVEPSESDIAVLLKDAVVPRMKVLGQEAGVEIQLEAPPSLTAWVDPVRFEELATNLIMNGIRYSPEGGTIWVRLIPDGEGIRFSVRDQGPNVPPEDQERIFRPFEQAQRTARMGGMGLGLFISRQIAQLHGGDVTLTESIAGRGNLFEATFPVRAVNAISA